MSGNKDGRASLRLKATAPVTAHPDESQAGRAGAQLEATRGLTVPPETIDRIRQAYRLAKTSEDTRNRLSSGMTAFVRTYVSGWTPDADKAERKKTADAAKRVVKYVLREERPKDQKGRGLLPYPEVLDKIELEPGDDEILAPVHGMILGVAGPWWRFEMERRDHRKTAEELCRSLPAWTRISHVRGFSEWGLVAIVGEFGDLTDNIVPDAQRKQGQRYSGVRRIYKRFGLVPDECYPIGEKRGGRKIPRSTRGRIMGIVAEALLRQQWRGERENAPAHAVGPFGLVYAEAKARYLADGRSKGHADKAARRAMVKLLIHDVHRAWHDKPLDYAAVADLAA